MHYTTGHGGLLQGVWAASGGRPVEEGTIGLVQATRGVTLPTTDEPITCADTFNCCYGHQRLLEVKVSVKLNCTHLFTSVQSESIEIDSTHSE